jgi:hypothetical protein
MHLWGPGPVIAGAVPKFNRPRMICGLQESKDSGRLFFFAAVNEE